MKIRKAKDSNNISQIVNSVLLDNFSTKENGFLTANLEQQYYADLIAKSDYCYIAYEEDKAVGFLLAFPSSHLSQDDDIERYFIQKYPGENFIYIFQIAVMPEYQKKGVARALYQKLFDDTNGIRKMVATSVVPYNSASEKFHLKMEFSKVGTLTRDDGGSSYIYEFSS